MVYRSLVHRNKGMNGKTVVKLEYRENIAKKTRYDGSKTYRLMKSSNSSDSEGCIASGTDLEGNLRLFCAIT